MVVLAVFATTRHTVDNLANAGEQSPVKRAVTATLIAAAALKAFPQRGMPHDHAARRPCGGVLDCCASPSDTDESYCV